MASAAVGWVAQAYFMANSYGVASEENSIPV